jgi:hypothetical protein
VVTCEPSSFPSTTTTSHSFSHSHACTHATQTSSLQSRWEHQLCLDKLKC